MASIHGESIIKWRDLEPREPHEPREPRIKEPRPSHELVERSPDKRIEAEQVRKPLGPIGQAVTTLNYVEPRPDWSSPGGAVGASLAAVELLGGGGAGFLAKKFLLKNAASKASRILGDPLLGLAKSMIVDHLKEEAKDLPLQYRQQLYRRLDLLNNITTIPGLLGCLSAMSDADPIEGCLQQATNANAVYDAVSIGGLLKGRVDDAVAISRMRSDKAHEIATILLATFKGSFDSMYSIVASLLQWAPNNSDKEENNEEEAASQI